MQHLFALLIALWILFTLVNMLLFSTTNKKSSENDDQLLFLPQVNDWWLDWWHDLYSKDIWDETEVTSMAGLAMRLESEVANLPLSFWQENIAKWHKLGLNQSCARMPNLLDLRYNNIYWQQVLTTNGTLYLYGAYLDLRDGDTPRGPKVRLLGMMNRLRPKVELYCQLWFEKSNQPAISRVTNFTHIWTKESRLMGNGPLQPYLLTCPLPPSHVNSTPILVSLVEKVCDTSTALLKITFNQLETGEERKKIGICVKGIDFQDDLSLRLVLFSS